MKNIAMEGKDRIRPDGARAGRIVLIAFAIVEAILIFGVVVPAMFKGTPSGSAPNTRQEQFHDRPFRN